MTLRTIAAAVMAVFISTPALAQERQCTPLIDVAKELADAGVAKENFSAIRSEELPAIYAKNAGFAVPEDSDPIGITFLLGPNGVAVAFVERDLCIKYVIVIPTAKHEEALRASTRAA
jgi:hypothetical protein